MSLGLLGSAPSGRRRVITMCGQGVGAVSLGLLTRVASGWRRVIGIGGQGAVWVALCHCALLLGLVGSASCVVWVARCHWDLWGAGLVQNSHL